mmetsp:Transcript_38167/g.110212  ORF Transcript_38167/g.110212 Transcript_38167/m.110212 type:complete len:249 (-) Transcript_38167:507-1253(-)
MSEQSRRQFGHWSLAAVSKYLRKQPVWKRWRQGSSDSFCRTSKSSKQIGQQSSILSPRRTTTLRARRRDLWPTATPCPTLTAAAASRGGKTSPRLPPQPLAAGVGGLEGRRSSAAGAGGAGTVGAAAVRRGVGARPRTSAKPPPQSMLVARGLTAPPVEWAVCLGLSATAGELCVRSRAQRCCGQRASTSPRPLPPQADKSGDGCGRAGTTATQAPGAALRSARGARANTSPRPPPQSSTEALGRRPV